MHFCAYKGKITNIGNHLIRCSHFPSLGKDGDIGKDVETNINMTRKVLPSNLLVVKVAKNHMIKMSKSFKRSLPSCNQGSFKD